MIKSTLQVPEDLKEEIIGYVYSDESRFTANGPQRKFCNLNNTDTDLKYKVQRFAEYCYGVYDINVKTEPKFGNFIGVNLEGGAVHFHRDSRSEDGEVHVRINFLLSKPHIGGMPIINTIEYKIDEGDCWVNLASEDFHQSSMVQGDKARIVLSLGSYVNGSQLVNFKR